MYIFLSAFASYTSFTVTYVWSPESSKNKPPLIIFHYTYSKTPLRLSQTHLLGISGW